MESHTIVSCLCPQWGHCRSWGVIFDMSFPFQGERSPSPFGNPPGLTIRSEALLGPPSSCQKVHHEEQAIVRDTGEDEGRSEATERDQRR